MLGGKKFYIPGVAILTGLLGLPSALLGKSQKPHHRINVAKLWALWQELFREKSRYSRFQLQSCRIMSIGGIRTQCDRYVWWLLLQSTGRAQGAPRGAQHQLRGPSKPISSHHSYWEWEHRAHQDLAWMEHWCQGTCCDNKNVGLLTRNKRNTLK